jgi:hypothetical protein
LGQRRLEVALCLGEATELALEPAVVVQGVGVARIKLQRAPEAFVGPRVVAQARQNEPPQAEGRAEVGSRTDGLLDLLQRRAGLAAGFPLSAAGRASRGAGAGAAAAVGGTGFWAQPASSVATSATASAVPAWPPGLGPVRAGIAAGRLGFTS